MGAFKQKFVRLIAMTMTFVMVMALTGCVEKPPVAEEISYTVYVANKAGTALEKCRIDIYTPDNRTAPIYTGITDKNGAVTFSATAADYVAVVSKQPTGYAVAESYALEGEKTTIVLTADLLTDEDLDNVEFSLGDMMKDFYVTTPDGDKVVLSALLQEKKAVVLNFWFLNCQPCKMEFPYIQQGYEQLSSDIAVLAMNPYDGSDGEVASFRDKNGYTFIMAKCDSRWEKMMKIMSYPTSIVIDRYGNICLVHNGMIKSVDEFIRMVEYFISDDYEQQFFKSVGQIPTNVS